MAVAPVLLVTALASSAISAVGAIQAGKAQKAAADRDAEIAERNAKLVNQDRLRAVQTAQVASEDKSRSNRRQLASIRAAYGSSGFELAGSPLDVLADTSQEMALDTRRIENEGYVRNREGALKMLYLQEDAQTSRAAGKQAVKASYFAAGASLADGASKAAGAAAMM